MKRVPNSCFRDPTADAALANVMREQNPPKRGRKRLPAWVERLRAGRETVKV